MGDGANFHAGKKASNEGLEFVGGKKKSLFAQYTAQFSGQTSAGQPAPTPHQPVAAAPPTATVAVANPADDFFANIQDTPEQQLPTDMKIILNDDKTLKDIPKSHIKRPQHPQQQAKDRKVSTLKIVLVTTGVFVGIGIVALSIMFFKNNQPAVSESMRQQAGFPVYEMANNETFKVDKKSATLSPTKSLVYIAYEKDNNARFVISQQAIPDVVKTDAQYQQFLLDTDKFASSESKIGKAYFTKPANLGEDISVVVKTPTTLLFIRGSGTTNEQTWQRLLGSLAVVK